MYFSKVKVYFGVFYFFLDFYKLKHLLLQNYFTQMKELRKYQIDAVDYFLTHNSKSYLRQLETGLGKTEIAIEITRRYNLDKKRVIFFTHTLELRDQTLKRFIDSGIDCGVIAAGKKFESGKLCYIAMVQTVASRIDKEELVSNDEKIKEFHLLLAKDHLFSTISNQSPVHSLNSANTGSEIERRFYVNLIG